MPLIKEAIDKHWNGQYLQNTDIRKVDGSVLHAIVSFSYFALDDEKVLKTLDYYNEEFCTIYPINQDDNKAKIPGNLIGRYPGDHYAGGNPW